MTSAYLDLARFLGGAILANGVPHFVQGVSGRRFQTPFASPRGVGESSAVVNVVWGFANLVVGLALARWDGSQPLDSIEGSTAFAAGVLAAGILLSRHFERVRGRSA